MFSVHIKLSVINLSPLHDIINTNEPYIGVATCEATEAAASVEIGLAPKDV